MWSKLWRPSYMLLALHFSVCRTQPIISFLGETQNVAPRPYLLIGLPTPVTSKTYIWFQTPHMLSDHFSINHCIRTCLALSKLTFAVNTITIFCAMVVMPAVLRRSTGEAFCSAFISKLWLLFYSVLNIWVINANDQFHPAHIDAEKTTLYVVMKVSLWNVKCYY